jgi:hypothetical protein
MPYLGNELATQFQAFVTQTITGDGSTGYTLDRAVANGKELLVYINNVKQEEGSGKAYTASGTTITFSEAVASTDSCYVVFLGSAVQTVNPPDGSVGSSKISSADLVLPKTVTIGSAGAEDTKLVFDGNAQDFHIGLDDSADSLTIGLGSTLGTTSHMVIDANGHITKPLQPAFLAQPASAQTDIPKNAVTTMVFGTERYDQNGDFSSNTFTAPVTGKYLLTYSLYFQYVDGTTDYLDIILDTSNRDYYNTHDPEYIQDYSGNDVIYFTTSYSVIADMDANDTAFVKVGMNNSGADQMDLQTSSTFSGCLLA